MRKSARPQEAAAEKIITAKESRTSCWTRRAGGTVLPLDFTAAMPATGLYYLLLASPLRTAQLKLIRQ